MAYYSQEILEELKSQSDIVEVVSEYVPLKRQGSGYVARCPFHNEKTGSFHVNPQGQYYYCFGCKAGGNIFSFLMNMENMIFPEAVERVAERCHYALPERGKDGGKSHLPKKNETLLSLHKMAAQYYYRMLRQKEHEDAYAYFVNRKISQETMHQFGLGYTGKRSDGLYRFLKENGFKDQDMVDASLVIFDEKRGPRDRFWNRVMFPIMDERRRVIAFGGRVMGKGEPKYLNSSETAIFEKSKTLYALFIARRTRQKMFILCEGYMDVISLHQAGFDNAIATLGTSLTLEHGKLLSRFRKAVYLCYDADEAGQKAIQRAFGILRGLHVETRVISLAPHKDPDDFIKAEGKDAFLERIKEAQNGLIYVLHLIQKEYDIHDPAGLSQFHNRIAEELVVIEDKNERDNYIAFCAKEFSMSHQNLVDKVNELGSKRRISSIQRDEPLSRNRNHKTRENGTTRGQKYFLYWMMMPKFFQTMKKYISVEDFEEGPIRDTAAFIYQKMEKDGFVNDFEGINQFDEAMQVNMISEIYYGMREEFKEKSEEETILAIQEVTKNLLVELFRKKRRQIDPNDATGYHTLWTKEQESLKEIENLQFQELLQKESM